MKKNLYALLVAINEYPNPAHRLRGCVNDCTYFKAFLKERFDNIYEIHWKVLLNEKATRAAVIDGFDHFDQAGKEDVCLFFFAGHGSQIPAPPAFQHLESDQHLETIVCYDSREPDGKDLVDKELSYLIWKAAYQKKLHFVVIMDCCHSGTNTRDEIELDVLARNMDPREEGFPAEQFLGYEHYLYDEAGRLTPPRARHLQLAAALPDETAKEVRFAGKGRGVFSFCLLEALNTTGRPLSYAEAMHRAELRVRGVVRSQSPRLYTSHSEDKELTFLTLEKKERDNIYFLTFNINTGEWRVSAGAIHGVPEGLQKYRPTFLIKGTDIHLPVIKVYASYSKVTGLKGMNTKGKYEAVLIMDILPIITLAFAPKTSSRGKEMLIKVYKHTNPTLFTIVDRPLVADYLIYADAEEEKWALTLPLDKRSLFRRVGPFTEEVAEDFLKKLEALARWRQVRDLEGMEGAIGSEEILIQLERLTDPGNYTFDAPAEPADWRQSLKLAYRQHQGQWHQPAFRMKVKNTGQGNRKLWVSVLYMEDNFGISNELLPDVELAPGEAHWLEYPDGQYRTNAIQVWMDDIYHQWGIYRITEYLKVIISTERLRTDGLNQQGLPLEGPYEGHRGLWRQPEVNSSGWKTELIILDIQRPIESL